MQVVRFFPEIFFIWIMIGNVTSFRIRDPSKIMTAGSNQEHNQNYQNQNYQINQIDDNFFLTTAVPDSLPTSTPENIDLSHNTQNNDFGQNSGQFVGPTSIHKIKCEEYSSYFRNFKDVPKEQNSLPFQLFIVGGVGSEEKEFPHMAALGYGKGEEKQWLCGGSLISERFVLTAAHCLTSKQIGDVQIVRLGTTTLQTETLESMDYGIYRKIPHPRYVVGQQYNDIALIELDHPVKFTEFIRPICLDDENGYTGRKLIATGWGRIQATGSVSKDLQKVDLDYFPMTNANKSMQRYLSRIYRMA
ncbi:unnamed protein product [Acanthoscelides obtectus]|uniref:Peptidase S1 domain-containing protein n=1 Tax=Acanthoscelides obtectus TaxID=200917 RepID=A0A9P0PAG3_ACAOB|nr:unnamed protein product [Acanthoscelides obtectus]CAK1639570.1 Serine protease snake [Acanthoscelides obtectus]